MKGISLFFLLLFCIPVHSIECRLLSYKQDFGGYVWFSSYNMLAYPKDNKFHKIGDALLNQLNIELKYLNPASLEIYLFSFRLGTKAYKKRIENERLNKIVDYLSIKEHINIDTRVNSDKYYHKYLNNIQNSNFLYNGYMYDHIFIIAKQREEGGFENNRMCLINSNYYFDPFGIFYNKWRKTHKILIPFKYQNFEVSSDLNKLLEKELSEIYFDHIESYKVTILGYAGKSEGNTEEYSIALGQRRADNIENYLIKKGFLKKNISTISYGNEGIETLTLCETQDCYDKIHGATIMIELNLEYDFDLINMR